MDAMASIFAKPANMLLLEFRNIKFLKLLASL